MGGSTTVVFVTPDASPHPAAAALSEAGFVVEAATADDVADDADAVVVSEGSRDRWAHRSTTDVTAPVVLYGDRSSIDAATTRFDGFARRGDDAALVDQVRWVTQRGRDSRSRLGRLHDGTATLISIRSPDALYEAIVDIAEHILEFDNCDLMVADGDRFVSVAARGEFEGKTELPLDHGVLGETYRRGESILTPDMHDDDLSQPVTDALRTGISVPFGDVGVFQAASRRPHAYDETDVQLVEILLSYASETLSRIESETAVRAEHAKVSALFENVPDAVVQYEFVDGDPIVNAVNDAFVSTFGFGREEILGENLDDFVTPRPAMAEAEALNARLQRGESLRHQCRRQTANGTREFILHVVPLERGVTNLAGYAIYMDITERQRREQELRRQKERLGEFASLVSHDLRNPLSIARGYIELARDTGDENAFETALDALDRMDRLTEDVLALARQGRVVGDPDEVDAVAVARDAWSTVETMDASLVADGNATVEADEGRLRELLENLLRNAVEHGGADVTVRVGGLPDGFFVADDGPGIPAGEREAVFEAGHSASADGTGFGLAIVEQIAAAHGWQVTATESEDGGARFEVRSEAGLGVERE